MRFQNGCNKVVIELRVVQFWSEIILVISNRTRTTRSFDFEITRMMSDQIALHSGHYKSISYLFHHLLSLKFNDIICKLLAITCFVCLRYMAFVTGSSEELDIREELLNRDYSVSQYAGFLACLCSTLSSEEQLLILRCFPLYKSGIVCKEVSERKKVILQGEGTSLHSISKEDEAFFCLSDDLTPRREQNYMEITSIK